MTLIKQSFEFARSLGADCYRFDSDTHAGAVYADLVNSLMIVRRVPAGALSSSPTALFDIHTLASGRAIGIW